MTNFEISPQWDERLGNEENKKRRFDHRSPYQRDRARILHSAAFRRLQSKTQVLGTGTNDFYRTRLTHSLEVSQIGTGIVAQLKQKQPAFSSLLPSTSLIEAICLSHDIGHPPYGHGGEVALNYMMREHGGFEGNGQTLRIVTKLEPYTPENGMNLARRSLLGLLKYPALISQIRGKTQPEQPANFRQLKASEWSPAKGIYDDDKQILDWVLAPLSDADRVLFATTREQKPGERHLKTRYKSIDCSIMELADDFAYGIHDLEDAIAMGIVNKRLWQEQVACKLADIEGFWLAKDINLLTEQLFSSHHYLRKDAIGALVNALITSVEIKPIAPHFNEPLLAYNAWLNPDMEQVLEILKQFVLHFVIQKTELQIMEYKGQQIVMELFEAFAGDPERLLPNDTKARWQLARALGHSGYRVIADYISGMTDGHAVRLHSSLFSAHSLGMPYQPG
ncbi:anti-phage deoxyguanosine triphosphatase [Motilimonas cestriensis]|uniref:anti-phage deoxyguanosine triphosphatase n=1 Tax=Motilimonas cestriensis TaxID=2742685 RepID=UPI003DA5807C